MHLIIHKHTSRILVLIISLSAFVSVANINAQKDYEENNSLPEYDYYIKGELVLDYSSTVFVSELDNKTTLEYHIVAPLFLSFNRNDLKYFRAEPGKMYIYADAFLGTTNYFSNSMGENEKFAGMMQAKEFFRSDDGGITTEVNATGKIDQPVEIVFKMFNAEEEIRKGSNNFLYRLYITTKTYPNSEQKDVSGSTKSGEISFTEGTRLDINIAWGSTFGTDLANHILKNNMESVGGKEKDEFEARFEKEYYKTLPQTDALKLNEFLINPVGTYEIPINGFFNSPDGKTEKTIFKGTLRLFGNEVLKYQVDETEE